MKDSVSITIFLTTVALFLLVGPQLLTVARRLWHLYALLYGKWIQFSCNCSWCWSNESQQTMRFLAGTITKGNISFWTFLSRQKKLFKINKQCGLGCSILEWYQWYFDRKLYLHQRLENSKKNIIKKDANHYMKAMLKFRTSQYGEQ